MDGKRPRWRCSILEDAKEKWKFAVCWSRKRGVMIPSLVFETCNPELYERAGLPKYVAERLASQCRKLEK